jgi:hypothetical protein
MDTVEIRVEGISDDELRQMRQDAYSEYIEIEGFNFLPASVEAYFIRRDTSIPPYGLFHIGVWEGSHICH